MIVVLDGIDGCGKTTLAARVATALDAAGWQVKALRDPGGTDLGEKLRTLVKDARVPMDPHTQMLLFSAARCELARQVIMPWLFGPNRTKGARAVVLDRWWFSTFAYQTAQGVSGDLIRQVADGTSFVPLHPKRTFWLHVPALVGLARRAAALGDAGAHDRFDQQGQDFAEKVQAGYAKLHAEGHVTRVQADRLPDAVFADVWKQIEENLPSYYQHVPADP